MWPKNHDSTIVFFFCKYCAYRSQIAQELYVQLNHFEIPPYCIRCLRKANIKFNLKTFSPTAHLLLIICVYLRHTLKGLGSKNSYLIFTFTSHGIHKRYPKEKNIIGDTK